MQPFIVILIVIASIIALLLIIAAFLPKKVDIKAATTIDASIDSVRDFVKILDNQRYYSVRVMADPTSKMTYTGTDGTIWASMSRDSTSNKVWAWTQTIIDMTPLKSITIEIQFDRPMKWTNHNHITMQNTWNQTTVTQNFIWPSPRPFNIMTAIFLPKLQSDLQQSMDNLKQHLEHKM